MCRFRQTSNSGRQMQTDICRFKHIQTKVDEEHIYAVCRQQTTEDSGRLIRTKIDKEYIQADTRETVQKRLGKDGVKVIQLFFLSVSLMSMLVLQREERIRCETLLTRALPEDHLTIFIIMIDAKGIWMAVMLSRKKKANKGYYRSLELDVELVMFGVKAVLLHSFCFIGVPALASKLTYADQQEFVSISFSDICWRWKIGLDKVANGYALLRINQVWGVCEDSDDKRYSAFKVTEVKTDEPKALVSVDSMVNWSDHAAENKTGWGGCDAVPPSITGTYFAIRINLRNRSIVTAGGSDCPAASRMKRPAVTCWGDPSIDNDIGQGTGHCLILEVGDVEFQERHHMDIKALTLKTFYYVEDAAATLLVLCITNCDKKNKVLLHELMFGFYKERIPIT
ncbi:hypothetical protein Tco_1564258 [Tanacetum coccineum]